MRQITCIIKGKSIIMIMKIVIFFQHKNVIYHVPLQYFTTNSLHNRGKMCQPCHPVGLIMVNLVWFTRKKSHLKCAHYHNTETETPNKSYVYIHIVGSVNRVTVTERIKAPFLV